VKLIVTAPLARYCGAMIVMMIVVTGAVHAEPVFSFNGHAGQAAEDGRSDQLFNRAET
jgi:hypothetical protein